MRVYHPTDRPWDHVRIPPAWATGLPDVADLVGDAQLGPVALLQAAASVTESALISRYGACGDISDEVFEPLAPQDHSVLEVDESLTPAGLALELHIVAHWDGSGTRAWWELEDGTVLRVVRVGIG